MKERRCGFCRDWPGLRIVWPGKNDPWSRFDCKCPCCGREPRRTIHLDVADAVGTE